MADKDETVNQLNRQQLGWFTFLEAVSIAGLTTCFILPDYLFAAFFVIATLVCGLSFYLMKSGRIEIAKRLALVDFVSTLIEGISALSGLMFMPRGSAYGDILVVTIALGARLFPALIYTRAVHAG